MTSRNIISAAVCILMLASCKTAVLPPFSGQRWHVDTYTGHAVSDRGMELGFGSEWMVVDTTLIQSADQLAPYPELEKHLAREAAEFPEIAVDSILFYNPARGLLFATYHQDKPLKPSSELWAYNDTVPVYSEEHAKIFGQISTWVDDDGWENGPESSAYRNIRYKPGKKQLVLLHRVPYRGQNLAIFQMCKSRPGHGRAWAQYPIYPFWDIDLGNPGNIEYLSLFLQAARTTAVVNLQLGSESKKRIEP